MITTKEKIIEYLKKRTQSSAKELRDYLEISNQALYKHIAKLLFENKISKFGTAPKVVYAIQNELKLNDDKFIFDKDLKKQIENNFFMISPIGERKEGINGFIYWCNKNKQNVLKTAKEYVSTLLKYNNFKKDGFIDGSQKMKNTFKILYLDKIFYLDFYSIERFGKTKLGQMLLYAKQSQNRILIKELVSFVQPQIIKILKKFNIEAIVFVPPTVKREIQFMKEFEKYLNLDLPKINIVKIRGEFAVPQKTLNKLEDRVENADKTFVVNSQKNYKNILIIDDAIGSGATLNEIAKKIKHQNICKGQIIGLSITGSFKGFDVISEV